MIATMSSGYDSPAVVALAKKSGLREAIAFRTNWRGLPDNGEEVARCLGIDLTIRERGVWRGDSSAAIPFLAADANGGDVDFKGFEDLLQGRVLLTGHMGYMMWHKREPKTYDHRLARRDLAGLSLSEYRLWTGFIHCPVPIMGAWQVEKITAIGRSADLAPWNVEGSYNRPIPRRIVEEAGVPRGAFAVEKKGVSIRISEPQVFWSGSLMDDYLRWLDSHTWQWLKRGRVPPRVMSAIAQPCQRVARSLARLARKTDIWPLGRRKLAKRVEFFGTREYLYKFAFPWAVTRAQERYAAPPIPEPALNTSEIDREVVTPHGTAPARFGPGSEA